MCSITSAPGSYLEFKSRFNRVSVQARQVCQGQGMVYSIGRENILVCKKSCALTKEQEKRKEKSDKLSVFKYQLLNRYFQIYQYFILTKNLESLHYLFFLISNFDLILDFRLAWICI